MRGLPNKEIAARLGIKRRAVEATLTRTYERLRVDSRSALIALVLSERGFGLALAQRAARPSAIGALGVPNAVDDQTRAYAEAPFMVAVTHGADHRYTFVNNAAAAVAGRTAESLIGRRIREVFPELDPQFIEVLDMCYRSGVPQSIGAPTVARMTREDGSVRERVVNLVFQPVRDATGAVIGLLHIGTEGSDRDQ